MNECYKSFDESPLGTLLRYDTWHPNIAIPLICDIDPEASVPVTRPLYWDEDQIYPMEHPDYPVFESIRLLSQPAGYLIKCLFWSDDEREQAELDDPSWITGGVYSVLLKDRIDAQERLAKYWSVYCSNPDHVENPVRSPQYFIDWAQEKSIAIPWLSWAHERGYIENRNKPSSSDAFILDKRERDTLHALIGALLFKIGIDPSKRGAVKQIVGLTEDYGAPIGKTKISEIRDKIPQAKESVQDRKRR